MQVTNLIVIKNINFVNNGLMDQQVSAHHWWGVWVMVGVQGKVAFGLSHFCILSFSKKV